MRVKPFLLLGVPLIALGVIVLAFLRAEPQPTATYRVDAIFDTAKGVIPGQLVKVAGARAGEVEDVTLTPNYKARIKMAVDPRFGPFRSNARCSIQPEGLISENFVQCDPGTPAGRELRPQDGLAATVPLASTSSLINLTDLFNIFRTPVRQRFSVVVATLGIGTAARGPEINDIIRRANPTLALVRRTLGIVDRQRAQLAGAVADTDPVVAELARRRADVRTFIDRGRRVAEVTADRRTPLAQAVRRLPPLLDEVHPAATRLDRLATDTAPVLADLRQAAPDLERLVRQLRPFAQAGLPAIPPLEEAAEQGRDTIRASEHVVDRLRVLADDLRPAAKQATDLVVDLRRRGGIESLLIFAYYGAAATARFDSQGHILPTNTTLNQCSLFATEPVDGCNSFYRGGSTVIEAGSSGLPSLPSRSGREGRRSRDGGVAEEAARDAGPGERAPTELLDFLLK